MREMDIVVLERLVQTREDDSGGAGLGGNVGLRQTSISRQAIRASIERAPIVDMCIDRSL